jgi:poly-gamma-glutamate synthesis protein (capsule biosynthesis protein)
MKLYRFIIDIGADIVIGHHSHVMGGYEFYQNKPIIYSLGNFIFDEEGNPEEWYTGAVAVVEFTNRQIAKFNIFKISLRNNKLEIQDKQNLLLDSGKRFFHYVYKEEVRRQWKNLIHQYKKNAPKSLLNFGITRRFFWKIGFKKLNKQDKKRLMVLENRLKCRTLRESNKSIIEMIKN